MLTVLVLTSDTAPQFSTTDADYISNIFVHYSLQLIAGHKK